MKIHYEELSDVRRYLENYKTISLDKQKGVYDGIMHAVKRYKTVDANTKIIEIGTGTGWFVLFCLLDGLQCRGMEISPALIQRAKEIAAEFNVEPDIELGNLEDCDLGIEKYDIAICSNVFEHVEFWREGIRKVTQSLKPGGLLFFESTNKFSFTSGEYSKCPLYGWMPNQMRYALRKALQGDDIMKLGIDFHQFRHSTLRREFEKNGYRTILDRVQMADENATSSAFRSDTVTAEGRLLAWALHRARPAGLRMPAPGVLERPRYPGTRRVRVGPVVRVPPDR